MEQLPQLKPLSLRPECEPGYEKESWKPTWNCFCCHDTGFVLDRLSSQIIPGFNSEQHKTLLCNAPGCNASRDKVSPKLIEEGNFDTRLSSEICDRLAQMEKESWEDYRWKKHRQSLMGETPKTALAHQLRKEALGKVEELAEKKSMRTVGRSEKEQKQARERHLRVVENY